MNESLRVFLVGRSAEELRAFRRRLAGHQMSIAGEALQDEVQSGRVTVPPYIDLVVMSPQAITRSAPPPPHGVPSTDPGLVEQLTPREQEILVLVADGHGNRDVARLLDISEHTVKFHLASVFGKLGVSSRTEAARKGLRLGLIDI